MRKIKLYNTTRMSRKFLTNISYNKVKEEDLFDRNFALDAYILTTKKLNSFSLERKIFDAKYREMMHMFWVECNELSFYKHICKADNFMYLNSKKVIYLHATEIVWMYLEEDEENFDKIKKNLIEDKKIFQFIPAHTLRSIVSSKTEAWNLEIIFI